MTQRTLPFADWLEASGYSVKDVATLCNVSRQTVHAWKRYESEPSLHNYRLLVTLSQGQLTARSFVASSSTSAGEDKGGC